MSTFPATNSNEAVELIIDGGNQLHQIINEDATTEVQTESGPIPSVRKALADTFLFLEPIPWQDGSDETAFNQLRTFNSNVYWAPSASLSTPVPMGATPIGDSNWVLAPVNINKEYIDGEIEKVEVGILRGGTYKGENGIHIQNGDDVPPNTEFLYVNTISGVMTLKTNIQVSGVVSNLTAYSAIIGGVSVKFGLDYEDGFCTPVEVLTTNGSIIDIRDDVYSLNSNIYVPEGFSFLCNLKPDDDVRLFKGYGTFQTTDQWGNTHTFNIGLSNGNSLLTTTGLINRNCRLGEALSVGIIGDSVTDGADSTGWLANPTDVNGNLSSTNYNHNTNGGSGSWFRYFIDNTNYILTKSTNPVLLGMNASSSGKKLIDGWAYRNFDYGFFQNSAYGNQAPSVLLISMGINDVASLFNKQKFTEYFAEFEKIIRKAQGYGSSVGFITLNTNLTEWKTVEKSIKSTIERQFPSVEYFDLSVGLDKFRRSGDTSLFDLWYDISNIYDITHPLDIGHKFIGSYMTKLVVGSSIIDVYRGYNVIPHTNSDFIARGFPSSQNLNPTIENVSGNLYLDELKSLTYITPNSENVIINIPLWCEDLDLSLIIFEPRVNSYTTSGRNHSVEIIHSDINTSGDVYNLASTGKSTFPSYKTSKVKNLKYGLNWVKIIYDGKPDKVTLPILMCRKLSEVSSVPERRKRMPAGDLVPLSMFGGFKGVLKSDYQPQEIMEQVADTSNGTAFSAVGYVTFTGSTGISLSIGRKYGTDEGVKVKISGPTSVEISNYDGSNLQTLTLDTSLGLSVDWVKNSTGLSVTVISVFDTTNQTIQFNDVDFGYCQIQNETLSTQTVFVRNAIIQAL